MTTSVGVRVAEDCAERPLDRALDRADLGLAAVCAVVTAAAALAYQRQWGGALPIDNIYFGGDPHRIMLNLASMQSDFHRTPFHPLFAALCAVFEQTRAFAGADLQTWLALTSAIYGAAVGGLTYVAARAWGATALWAVVAVYLVLGSAAFVAWSSVPEAHVWGGLTVLGVAIGARCLPGTAARRALASGALFVLASSMVFTNVLAWLFATAVDRPGRLLSPSGVAAWIRRNAAPMAAALVVGLILLELAFVAERAWFAPNDSLGQLFQFAHDEKYFMAGGRSHLFGAIDAFGFLPPTSGINDRLALAVGGAFLIFCLAPLLRTDDSMPSLRLMIPAILLLHTVYDRKEAFLCSPNYIGVLAMIFAVTASARRRSAAWTGAVVAGLTLLMILNIRDHLEVMQHIRPQDSFRVG
jgi:hypothetical protein